MEEALFSIRMHASSSGEHVSGAENLVGATTLDETAAGLIRRALLHPLGPAGQIKVTIDRVDAKQLQRSCLPQLKTIDIARITDARRAARNLLELSNVAPVAASAAMRQLEQGAAPGGRSMRGAMLVDCQTGQRRESDQARGIRVSRVGMTVEVEKQLAGQLAPLGLDNPHVREALVLAGKVAMHPSVIAELCWSDDPDYTAGYVCSRRLGYVRFPKLKPAGEVRGGRAYFVLPGCDLGELTAWLETSPVLFSQAGSCSPSVSWREYAREMDTTTG